MGMSKPSQPIWLNYVCGGVVVFASRIVCRTKRLTGSPSGASSSPHVTTGAILLVDADILQHPHVNLGQRTVKLQRAILPPGSCPQTSLGGDRLQGARRDVSERAVGRSNENSGDSDGALWLAARIFTVSHENYSRYMTSCELYFCHLRAVLRRPIRYKPWRKESILRDASLG